jgi:hypothetical protein
MPRNWNGRGATLSAVTKVARGFRCVTFPTIENFFKATPGSPFKAVTRLICDEGKFVSQFGLFQVRL